MAIIFDGRTELAVSESHVTFAALEPERIAELSAYRREVDPEGLMNPGKLMMPASNMKLLPLAAAAEKLGWDRSSGTGGHY